MQADSTAQWLYNISLSDVTLQGHKLCLLQQDTLCMNAEAEQLQVRALTAVLPVRLKMLDTAGGEPYITTYEPVLPLSRPTTSTQAQTTASAADGAAESAQQV